MSSRKSVAELRTMLPRMRGETAERIRAWWTELADRDMESYWLCFRACVAGGDRTMLAELDVNASNGFYNARITGLLLRPENAEITIFLLERHGIGPLSRFYRMFSEHGALFGKIAAMDERVVRLIAPSLNYLDSADANLCVMFANAWPGVADENRWFRARGGEHFFADNSVRFAIRHGAARALRYIIERARASDGVCGVIMPPWRTMVEMLAHASLEYDGARAVLRVIDTCRPADAPVFYVRPYTINTSGVLLALQSYVPTESVLPDPDGYGAPWASAPSMLSTILDILRARRIALSAAQRDTARGIFERYTEPGTRVFQTPLHSNTLCARPWTAQQHAHAGLRCRRAAAAVLAVRRTNIAAIILTRTLVDAHRVLPLEAGTHLSR
jgi:hypothetical protein